MNIRNRWLPGTKAGLESLVLSSKIVGIMNKRRVIGFYQKDQKMIKERKMRTALFEKEIR
jgi:hypothetical protein